MSIENLLNEMVKKKASDLILKDGSQPFLRINGELSRYTSNTITLNELENIISEIKHKSNREISDTANETVLTFGINNLGRFRSVIFRQRESLAIVIRAINSQIPSFEELNLPVKTFQSLSSEKRGLILITGATGSGKSTTVASMIEYINQNTPKHIITLEDPIEFMFRDAKSIICQREVKIDTENFKKGVEYAMLQNPDIIFIGDIRNLDVMETVLMAAETGHLVIANLHTINTTHTIERIVNFFPPHQHQEILMQLSLLLKGIISLRLIPLKDQKGRIPACEVLIPSPTIIELIREGKLEEIEQYIRDGELYGMQTFDQVLIKLYKNGLITEETALNFADRKNELTMNIKNLS